MNLTVKSLNLAVVAATFIASATAATGTLPEGYAQVEYIESTGTQWIDTGVKPSADLVTELRFTPLASVTGEHILFGAGFVLNGYMLALFHGNYGLRWHSGGTFQDGKAYATDQENTIVCSKIGTSADVSKNILIFDADGAGETKRGIFRLHQLTMTAGGEVIRNFQPAIRIADEVAGLVDLSATPENGRKVFYANEAGGEDFLTPLLPGGLIIAAVADETFTGLPLTPSPRVEVLGHDEPLVQGRDYTVAYSNNLVIGVASLTVTCIGDYASLSPGRATFRILQPPDDRIQLPDDLGVQFCSAGNPARAIGLTVRDWQGNLLDYSQYELVYYNNTAPGTAVVQVKVTSGPCAGGSAVRQFTVVNQADGYHRVAYIEGTGTQWFDTGVVPSQGLTTRIKFTVDQTVNKNNVIFGAEFTAKGYLLMMTGNIGNIRWHTGGSYADSSISFDTPVVYTAVGRGGGRVGQDDSRLSRLG